MWRQFAEIKVEKKILICPRMTFFVASPLDGLLITLYHPLMINNALANSWVAQQLILTQLTPVWKYTSRYEIQFFLENGVYFY